MAEVEFFLPIPIDELKGFYEVGSFGSVKKLSRKSFAVGKKCPDTKEIIRKPNTSHKDYHKVYLSSYKGKGKWYYVHRLVALAFLELVDGKTHVNHKDADKGNNKYTNLEWCTPEENNKHWHSLYIQKYGKKEKPPLKKRWEKNMKGGIHKPIIDLNTGVFWTSKDLSRLLGTKPKYINRMLSEERKPNTSQYRYA